MVIILLLVYRSPLLWLLPLFGAIGAIVVAKAATHGLASAGLTVSSLSAAILTVLVLGAASDYACCSPTGTGKNCGTTRPPRTRWRPRCAAPCRPWPPRPPR